MMLFRTAALHAALLVSCAVLGVRADRYVDVSNSAGATPPYTTWPTAATTIQDAVSYAMPGEHVVVAPGVYGTGGGVLPGYGLAARVVATNAIVILSTGGPQLTAIVGRPDPSGLFGNGSNAVRGVVLAGGAELHGFTVSNGYTFGALEGDIEFERSGGGILIAGAGSVSNCVIAGCGADYYGGGAFCLDGGTVIDTVLSGNFCRYYGGGAALSGTNHGAGALLDCSLSANVSSNLDGGGVYARDAGLISNCHVTGNTTLRGSGGGIGVFRGDVHVLNCTVTSNTAAQKHAGGVLFNSISTYNAFAHACTITDNSSGPGYYAGGMRLVNARAESCLIARNTSQKHGGGLYIYQSALVNCTVVSNTCADRGGGVYVLRDSRVENCVVYHNMAGEGDTNWYNDPGDTGIGYNYDCIVPNPSGVGNITSAPRVVNLAVGNYRLQPDSPCVNAGSNALAWSTTDLDGRARILMGRIDMGAYETVPEGGLGMVFVSLLSIGSLCLRNS